ncbi:MAG: hypothetical protein JW870_17855 [Candidatus Delongbacteria bacterium]|nr:hypothetical protein [Candidatus Delongbacteria bacterium]
MKKFKNQISNTQKQKHSSPSISYHTIAFFATHLLLWSFICLNSLAQNPFGTIPATGNQLPNTQFDKTGYYYPNGPIVPDYSSSNKSITEQNNEMILEQIKNYEADKRANDNLYREYEELAQLNYQRDLERVIRTNYRKAFHKLKSMLEGSTPLSLKQAVFEVEHAYNNTFTYEQFSSAIQHYVEIVQLKMALDKTNVNNSTINIAIAQVLSDTITLEINEQIITNYPLKYDFDDGWGETNWNKMFVSKLLFTGMGQCHSMPLLHLIIAEELNANAYLSLSPNHSFIKFENNNTLYNLETTLGVLVSDQWLMASGYVSTESIKNKIFLDTLNKKQVVANCLNDLASGYTRIFGHMDTTFIFACADLSLKYYDEGNAIAHVIKSNSYLANISYLGQLLNIPELEDALKIPMINKLWQLHDLEYQYLKSSGYKNIPKEEYDAWLQTARTDKPKQTNKQNTN